MFLYFVLYHLRQNEVYFIYKQGMLCFCVTLERSESEILEVTHFCEVAIDCTLSSESLCIEYRDNSTTMPRWLNIDQRVSTEDGQYAKPKGPS